MSTYKDRMAQKKRKTALFVPAEPYDEKYMLLAVEQAKQAERLGEVPVGAIVVYDGRVISSAHNRCESAKSALFHAEVEAIRNACSAIGGWRLDRCTLYVTLEPCPMCAGAIINSHLGRVVYGAKDPAAGAFGSVVDLADYPLGYKPKLTCGVLADQCSEILRSFFSEVRTCAKTDNIKGKGDINEKN